MWKSLTKFGWLFECWAVQKRVNLVDLVKSFSTSIYLQDRRRYCRERASQSLPRISQTWVKILEKNIGAPGRHRGRARPVPVEDTAAILWTDSAISPLSAKRALDGWRTARKGPMSPTWSKTASRCFCCHVSSFGDPRIVLTDHSALFRDTCSFFRVIFPPSVIGACYSTHFSLALLASARNRLWEVNKIE